MQIGFNLPISGPRAFSERLETLGMPFIVMAGRVPAICARRSGGVDGRDTPGHDDSAAICLHTRFPVMLAVMVVPHRPAVVAAKMLATIDVLSGGQGNRTWNFLDMRIGACPIRTR